MLSGGYLGFFRYLGFFHDCQMASPIQCRQVDVGNAAHGVTVQDQGAFDVNRAAALVKVGRVEIGRSTVQVQAQVGAAARLRSDFGEMHFIFIVPGGTGWRAARRTQPGVIAMSVEGSTLIVVTECCPAR